MKQQYAMHALLYNYDSTGLGDGMTPDRRQAITSANDDQRHRQAYASLCLGKQLEMQNS